MKPNNRNKKRQSTLVTKQRVLKDLFADAYEAMVAWPLEKEMQFVDAVLERYQGRSCDPDLWGE